jgi:hypothetical protein
VVSKTAADFHPSKRPSQAKKQSTPDTPATQNTSPIERNAADSPIRLGITEPMLPQPHNTSPIIRNAADSPMSFGIKVPMLPKLKFSTWK